MTVWIRRMVRGLGRTGHLTEFSGGSLKGGAEGVTALDIAVRADRHRAADLKALRRAPSGAVLLVGFAAAEISHLREGLGLPIALIAADSNDEALHLLADRRVSVVVLGGGLVGADAAAFLQAATRRAGPQSRRHIVLAGGSELHQFERLINDGHIYYLTERPPLVADTCLVVSSALLGYEKAVSSSSSDEGVSGVDSAYAQLILEISQAVAAEVDTQQAARLANEAVRKLLDCDAARCLLHDLGAGASTLPLRESEEGRQQSASLGLVGFVARTAVPAIVCDVCRDARYNWEADAGGEHLVKHLLAAPVTDGDGNVLAVLVGLRAPSREPFTELDLGRLRLLAEQVTPTFLRHALRRQVDRPLLEPRGAADSPTIWMFRPEAVEHHIRPPRGMSDSLRVSPGWVRLTYPLLVLGGLVVLASLMVTSIGEYASGPAVVRTAPHAGLGARPSSAEEALGAALGPGVVGGKLLSRSNWALGASVPPIVIPPFEAGAPRRLRRPADPRRPRQQGCAAVQGAEHVSGPERSWVRAPSRGRVPGIGGGKGKTVLAGGTILASESASTQTLVVSFFPARYRSAIRPGMPLDLVLVGFEYAHQTLVVDAVSDEVMGVAEARRLLGGEHPAAALLVTPVVQVTSVLRSRTFTVDGRAHECYEGMPGLAEVRVGNERLLAALNPHQRARF